MIIETKIYKDGKYEG